MKALVVGGNGFIGSSLVMRLVSAGHETSVFDAGAPRDDVDWSEVTYSRAMLSETAVLAKALTGVDVVYHCASSTVPSSSNLDPAGDVRQNLIGMLSLLDEMRVNRVRRIVYLSSGGTVYGNPNSSPVNEDHPLNPICSYGVVKVAVEKYLHMYQSLYGLEPVVLRPSNPYGPGQRSNGIQGLIATFLGKVRRGEPLSIWGDGEVIRDYIYIDDVVEIMMLAGEASATGVFNVGSGQGHSINDVVKFIHDITHASPEVSFLPARDFDVRRIVLDVTRSQEVFGWTPSTSMDKGIARAWDWLLGQDQGPRNV